MEPLRQKDASVLALLLFGAAVVFGILALSGLGGMGAGIASGGFAVAGGIVFAVATRLPSESRSKAQPPE